MTRDASRDDLCAAARRAWNAVPTWLRATKTQTRSGSRRIEFSDRRGT